MNLYLNNITTGILVFFFVGYVTIIPYAIWQYRKLGRFSFSRALLTYSFILYMLTAYFLVILPLPSLEEVIASPGQKSNFYPLMFIKDFWTTSGIIALQPATWVSALKHPTFYTAAFNFLLTLPFGVYCRRYLRLTKGKALLASFALTLFYELSQLSGLFFLYPKPYRTFDVDDLIINTLGSMAGYALGRPLAVIWPREKAGPISQSLEPVPIFRRFLAYLVDMLLVSALVSVGEVLGALLRLSSPAWVCAGLWLAYVLYFIVLAYFLHGRTPGKILLKTRVADAETGMPPSLTRLSARYGLWLLMFQLGTLFQPLLESASSPQMQLLNLLPLLLSLLGYGNLAWKVLRRKRILWYEELTHTKVVAQALPEA
ncbi:MAG: VanZ family protein [Candidatus Limiplasma sp.]|nr:VanZ family protein [Candidatus Limiplasma sp.]